MNDQPPDKFDQTLIESLQTRWPERGITDRQVHTLLANLETQARKSVMQSRLSTALRPLAFVGSLALLILFLAWTLGSLTPSPATENATASPAPTDSDIFPPIPSTATPVPTSGSSSPEMPEVPTSSPPSGSLPALFPNVTFDFAAPFPDSPAQITLYQQQLEGPLTSDLALQIAAQFGIAGEATSTTGEGGEPMIEIFGADANIRFLSFPGQFVYSLHEPAEGEILPFDQRVAIAEAFLNARGLLTFPYRVEPSDFTPTAVRFVALLDDLPVSYSIGYNRNPLEWITVSVDPAGQVDTVFHSVHTFQPLGNFPVLTAQQAWDLVATRGVEGRAWYAIQGAPLSWTRPASERPAEPYETFTGWLGDLDGQPTLSGGEGNLSVPNLPADFPIDIGVEVRGAASDGVLDWAEIMIDKNYNSFGMGMFCGFGGGGGGPLADSNFGGGNFATITLDPSTPPATGYISPIQPGDVLVGAEGILNMLVHIYPDGKEATEYSLWYAGDENTPAWQVYLEGDALAGFEQFHNLPIRVWGTATRLASDGNPILAVDRAEEAYPGLRLQAWVGTQANVTLEGKEVTLLTTPGGEAYVLYYSMVWGAGQVEASTVLIEGHLMPDQTWGGYPIIRDVAGSTVTEIPDLNTYSLESVNNYGYWDESAVQNPAATLTGHVTIETVELTYSTISLDTCTPDILNNPDFVPFLYVQPIWSFTGHFDDGRAFEIQIQALPDEYLR